MKRTKYFLIIFSFLIISFLLYKCSQILSRVEKTDYEYNTVYSEQYDETLFTNKLVGKSEKEILNILGKPIKKQNLKYYDAILYTNQNDSVDLNDEYGVEIKGIGNNLKFMKISFDSLNNGKDIFNREYYSNEDDLNKLNKNEIIKLLGFPQKELKRNNNYEVWAYSKIKDGSYSGKQPKINIRNLIFHRNVVVKLINQKGNALDLNIGTYEK